MRTQDVTVQMEIPIRFGVPDNNGVIYSKEAWMKALENADNLPIEIIHNDGTSTVVGVTGKANLVNVSDNEASMSIRGVLFHGGTSEQIEFQDGIVKSLQIISVGITK